MLPFNPTENPSYYRSHPFKNQYDLPNGAFKNRQAQNYYSEIPHGLEYFQPTSKKHYQNKSYRSQILQDNVLKEQLTQQQHQKSRIAMDKSYFRSLNVDDIEGAKPNTLISKAVKNREKAGNLMRKEQNSQYSNNNSYNQINSIRKTHDQNSNYQNNRQDQIDSKNEPNINKNIKAVNNSKNGFSKNRSLIVTPHQEALGKFIKSKSILQNNSTRALSTFIPSNLPQKYANSTSSQINSRIPMNKNYHFKSNVSSHQNRGGLQQNQNPLNNERSLFIQNGLLQEKQRRIRELEKELDLNRQNGYSKEIQYANGINNNSDKQGQYNNKEIKKYTNNQQMYQQRYQQLKKQQKQYHPENHYQEHEYQQPHNQQTHNQQMHNQQTHHQQTHNQQTHNQQARYQTMTSGNNRKQSLYTQHLNTQNSQEGEKQQRTYKNSYQNYQTNPSHNYSHQASVNQYPGNSTYGNQVIQSSNPKYSSSREHQPLSASKMNPNISMPGITHLPITQQMPITHQISVESKISMNKNNIRKFNPTFLSFESQGNRNSFNTAGRNIVNG